MCDEDEQLVRYYFGELTSAERSAFEQRLANEPDLAERLEKFTQCVAAQGDGNGCEGSGAEPMPIPRRLADRTTHAILACHIERAGECVGRKRFNFVELVAVGVAATFLGGLILPAIEASRESARRTQCAANLANIGSALQLYADRNGHFPRIGLSQNAGLFAVMLADSGVINGKLLQESMVCPSSQLSQQIAAGELRIEIPSPEELEAANRARLQEFRQLMAGSYAYRIGYFQGPEYVPFTGEGCCYSALLADSPSLVGAEEVVSRHHGECGENVLFEGGHVAFVSGCWAPDDVDHLYLNDDNQVAAGRHAHDIVLAPSEMTPRGVELTKLGGPSE